MRLLVNDLFVGQGVRWLFITVTSLLSLPLWAGESANLSGIHEELHKCSPKNGKSGGLLYMEQCYAGFEYHPSTKFSLVQNGNHVCGLWTGCSGWNCARYYIGGVVGRIDGEMVTLYSSNGHIESGNAGIDRFQISQRGELLHPESKSRIYIKTSPSNATPEQAGQCKPSFSEPVQIENYDLIVEGSFPSIEWFPRRAKPKFQAPKVYQVKLDSGRQLVQLRDGARTPGNLIPRTIWINNPTDSPWTIWGESESSQSDNIYGGNDDICAVWLKGNGADKWDDRYAWAYDEPNGKFTVIAPKSIRFTRICAGDTLRIEKSSTACSSAGC